MRTLRTYPDPILRQRCAPVTEFGLWLEELVRDMTGLIDKHDGAALAAPQAGEAVRVIVVRQLGQVRRDPPWVIVNPRIVATRGAAESVEQCLSLPDHGPVKVLRPRQIFLNFQGAGGNRQSILVRDQAAAVVCHECDHLEGRLLTDYAKREGWVGRIKRALKGKAA